MMIVFLRMKNYIRDDLEINWIQPGAVQDCGAGGGRSNSKGFDRNIYFDDTERLISFWSGVFSGREIFPD
jgi:hypothetical protein